MNYAPLSRKREAAPQKSGSFRVNKPNDAFEQEADRVAEDIMAGGRLQWSLSSISGGPPSQRKCACGGSGECEKCKEEKKSLQRKTGDGLANPAYAAPIVGDVLVSSGQPLDRATRALEEDRQKVARKPCLLSAEPAIAPPAVHAALREPGAPLAAAARGYFEPRFGHDFSSVRIHSGPTAHASARSVHALAYTVGSDIVFADGQYNPATEMGRKLLAHELAHTVQQSAGTAALQRQFQPGFQPVQPLDEAGQRRRFGNLGGDLKLQPPPPPPFLLPGEIPEAIILPAPPEIQLTPPSSLTPREPQAQFLPQPPQLTGPPPFTPVTITTVPRCVPDTSLTWTDFQGAPEAGRFAAKTSFTTPDLVIQGNPMFQARLNRSRSWVRPKYVDPTNHKTNGCAPLWVNGVPLTLEAKCDDWFKAHPGPGVTWSTPGTPDPKCPAGIVPTAVTATNVGQCATVVGMECDRVAPAESDRVLLHEQTHFDIACGLVNKANDALRAGGKFADIKKALDTQVTNVTRQYDTETDHGCKQAEQDTWVADVRAGLPKITIP